MIITNINEMQTTKRYSTKKKIAIFGDVHGMMDEFIELSTKSLNCTFKDGKLISNDYEIFCVGDLVDRGPQSLQMLDLCINSNIKSVIGNHDWKLLRYLIGRDVKFDEGDTGIIDAQKLTAKEKEKYIQFYLNCPLQYLINNQYIVTHGAFLNDDIDKSFKKSQFSNIYGCPTRMNNPNGTPERDTKWIEEYQLPYTIIYGHTPLKEVSKTTKTINIDTGAVFGNKLTAYIPTDDVIFQKQTIRPKTNLSTRDMQLI